jgi:hypothetical protein
VTPENVAEHKETLLQKLAMEEVSPEDKVRIVRAWEEAMGDPLDVAACGVCGIEDFQRVSAHPLESLQVLGLNDTEMHWYENIPREYRKYVCVVEIPKGRFWAHPRLVTSDGQVDLCEKCEKCCVAAEPKRPPLAIASGRHFGLRADLPVLTDLEERLIALVRTSLTTVKLVPLSGGSGGGWGIKGHTISFPHEGPEVVSRVLPNVFALKETKVIFVGPRATWRDVQSDMACKAKIERIFTVRWNECLKWLHVLKHINPQYANVDIQVDVPPEVDAFNASILARVEVCDAPECVSNEKRATCDITRECGEADLLAVEDAIMLTDGSVVGRKEDDVTQLVQTLRDLLNDKSTTFVNREKDPVNEFKDNAHLLMDRTQHYS